jgi:hypothetical protein
VEKDIKGRNREIEHFEYGHKLLLCLDVVEKLLAAGIFVPEVEPTGKVNQEASEN